MNDLFRSLFEELRGAGGGSKAVAVLVGAALLVVVGVVGVVSNKPDFQSAISGLDAHETAKVSKAISDSGIPFMVSQPPGPFTVFVDEGDRSAALAAAYGAGALDKPLKGIMTDPGVSSVFLSNAERMQMVQKRVWEEVEGMLEKLDFVIAAQVRSAPAESSPFSAATTGSSASVTVQVRGGERLSREQATNIAKLVSGALGISREHLTISDQTGRMAYDPDATDSSDRSPQDMLDYKLSYDRELSQRANGVLELVLGPNKSAVSVSSEWDFEQSITRSDTATGKGGVLTETSNATETPIVDSSPSVGGPPGVTGNVAGQDTGDGSARSVAPPPEPLVSTTSETSKTYMPSTQTEERVRTAPTLTRQSVALYLDESIPAELQAELESSLKATIGFVEERDEISRSSLAFYAPAEELEGEGTEEESGPNPMMETLLRRGVEIVTALIFVVLLLKSLKSSKKGSGQGTVTPPARPEDDIDAELLARAQVDELLKADPEKVGEILSSWARGEETAGASK